jgi:tRNA threonylcarbamoyladenosine biosynthesis protein TsaB
MANKRYLLAIDTATRYAGLALYDGGRILTEASWLSNNNHTVELMPALVRMLDQQDLSAVDLAAVAVSTGPGSFTGLRIGLSVAKGLSQAQSIPLLGVPTLDILAFQHSEQRRPIWAVIQAGRGRLCAALYRRRRGRFIQDGDLHLTTLSDLAGLMSGRCLLCGELRQNEIARLVAATEADVLVASPSLSMRRPACLAELAWKRFKDGESDDLAALSPVYLHTRQST